ncbi:phosphate uptake regulator PhoU [Haloplanus halophilus]|uniref:phosphate uptake regulator PhoU n=1 Tax=Haloplanus halophilus TaxID=2949993 RepID=UPI00203DF020|nr:phosphate uptake regulator PhoU [Haloplanus sp. GDY1]
METRKLQKIGGSTYSVSLPKEWATEHALEAGMPIHLYPHTDGSLVVRSAAEDGGALGATEIHLPDSDPDTVRRALGAAYAVGYDTVSLRSPDEFADAECRTVRRLVDRMVGMSVVEEGDGRVVVENLLDAGEVSIQQSVVQLQFTALSMQRTAMEALRNPDEAERLDGRDDGADRLFGMITRHFNRSLTDFEEIDHLDVRRSELFDYYLTARQLERVADHAVEVAALADRTDGTLPEEVLTDVSSLAERSRDVVETATTAVLESSSERAYAVLDRRDAVVDDARAIDRALFERSPPGAYALSRVLRALTRTAACGGNVARVALRTSLRPDG